MPGGELITMANMFKDLRNMTTLEGLKNWDTSRVGDVTGMFSSSKNDKGVTYTYSAGRLEKTEGTKGMLLKDITAINNWNITAVTSLEQMFENGIRIEKVDLSSWNMRAKQTEVQYLLDEENEEPAESEAYSEESSELSE